jgi:hypothetical protein
MSHRRTFAKAFLGALAVALVGLGVGFASNRFLPEPDSPAAPVAGPAGWAPVADTQPKPQPNEKPRPEPAPPVPRNAAAGKHALLVGVTRYDNLAPSSHLSGPGNDVKLLRTTLIERYGFPPENVVSLTEDEGAPDKRPTRANIVREFKRLAESARAGDQVVVLLAGHGDRQPEADPPDPVSPEPDGIDEIFLPADVNVWKGEPDRVPNAIIDNEIRDWLAAITGKKAHVWAIFDCCHSGSMNRKESGFRQLPTGVLVPVSELAKARERAAKRTGQPAVETKNQPFAPAEAGQYLVAMFACRAHETTPECPQPADSPHAKVYGLLTYTLVSALERSSSSPAPLTYRELMHAVQASYLSRPQGAPTPTVEGAGQDRTVLGTEKPVRPKVTLTRVKGEWIANVGDLHGVTPGSVLRVYSPPGEKKAPELIGYARVGDTRPLESILAPVPYADRPKPPEFPVAALCEIESIDYSFRRLRVGIDAGAGKPEQLRLALEGALKKLPPEDAGLFALVEDARVAHVLVRSAATGAELVESAGARPPLRLPAPDADSFGPVLTSKLKAIYRARSLISVGAQLEAERNRGGAGSDVKVEVLRHRGPEAKVENQPADGWVFRTGDRVSFRVTNTSPTKRLEVTLFVVGPDYQIFVLYPGRNQDNKALEPGAVLQTQISSVDDKPPFGPEHLIVLASAPTNPPVDLRLLTQPGQRETWSESKSPLAQLLDRNLYGKGTRSGLTVTEVEEQGARVLTWRTEPAPKK